MFIQFRHQLGELLTHYNLPRVVLELGVAEGWFTKDILKWDLDRLYLIDNWATIASQTGDGAFNQEWHDKNYLQLLERVEPFKYKVEIFRGLTTEMAKNIPDESLGLIYIDACHEYDAVKKDLEMYYQKVVPGGIIALHDYKNFSYGVNSAVKDFAVNYGYTMADINETEEGGDQSMVSAWFIKK